MNKRRKFSSAFKTKVVLEALSERYSIQELSRKHGVHANQISKWKNQFLANAETVFERPSKTQSEEELEKERLYKVISQQKIEIDFLKKALS
jgi:transposase